MERELIDLNELRKWKHKRIQSGECSYDDMIALGRFIEDVPRVDAVEVEWIPCDDRLPSEQGEYLVTTSAFDDYDYVDVLSFHKGKFYHTDDEWGDMYDDRVIAWMPLPKPYGERMKGADDDNND